MTEKKTFILDTSAIMSLVQDVTTYRGLELPAFAGVLGDNEIIIPRIVLDELNGLKRSTNNERAKTAMEAARQLEHYSTIGSLLDGIETEKGGTLRIASRPNPEKITAWGLKIGVADHEILATAIEIEDLERSAKYASFSDEETSEEPQVILITQDRILRILARSIYGINAEELKSICAPEFDQGHGYQQIITDSDAVDKALETGIYLPEDHYFSNEFLHIIDKENAERHYCYAIMRDPQKKEAEVIDRTKIDYLKVAGDVCGKNTQQKLLLWALMGCGDPDPMSPGGIRLITISGPAGSG